MAQCPQQFDAVVVGKPVAGESVADESACQHMVMPGTVASPPQVDAKPSSPDEGAPGDSAPVAPPSAQSRRGGVARAAAVICAGALLFVAGLCLGAGAGDAVVARPGGLASATMAASEDAVGVVGSLEIHVNDTSLASRPRFHSALRFAIAWASPGAVAPRDVSIYRISWEATAGRRLAPSPLLRGRRLHDNEDVKMLVNFAVALHPSGTDGSSASETVEALKNAPQTMSTTLQEWMAGFGVFELVRVSARPKKSGELPDGRYPWLQEELAEDKCYRKLGKDRVACAVAAKAGECRWEEGGSGGLGARCVKGQQ